LLVSNLSRIRSKAPVPMRAPGEGMLHGPYSEQHQPYHRCQGHNHQPVRPRVLQSEEVGEAVSRYPTEDQDDPEDSGEAFSGCDHAHPPCVGQDLDLVEAFCVKLLLGLRARLYLLQARPDIVDEGLPCSSPLSLLHQGCLPLLHQGPLFVDHFVSVGSGEFLEVGAFWLREPIAQPEDLRHGVCLLLDCLIGCLELLPHGDDHERQKHSVDHSQGRLDEASDVVVLLARLSWHEAVHQLQPAKREEANPADHEHAINYGEYQRGSPS
jgi:hypothetical protein